ncbi:hypothetical protein BC826DRAFT_1108778 [Russula brevipes]|nr:hypothetical protein BC826DRAFT_1108778 [Russula brevipes]
MHFGEPSPAASPMCTRPRSPASMARLPSPVARSPVLTQIALAMHVCSALIDEVASAAAPAACLHFALINEVANAAAPAARPHLTLIDEVASAAAPAACPHLAHLILPRPLVLPRPLDPSTSLDPSTPLLLSTLFSIIPILAS